MPIVTVSPPTTIKVQVGNQRGGTVQSISYGNKTLKGSSDLIIGSANTGDVISYNASTQSFSVDPVTVTIADVDAGYF